MIDNFADGNFSSNPEWIGHTDRFIVNAIGELQLQHNSPEANNTTYLSVAAATSINENTTWEFYIRMAFAASTTNFARVYLMASQPDLSGNLNGYYLKIGGISGSDDAIELYRQDGANSQLLLSGATGKAGTDPVLARVRITRSTTGEWTLLTDYEGGKNFQTEASATDATYATGNYFGLYCRYTSTRNQAFFFDDVSIDPLFTDTTPPTLLSAEAISATEVELNFDEPLDANSTQNINHYTISNGIGNPKSAILVTPTTIFLELNTPLQSGQNYTLTANNITDLSGNASMNQTAMLIFFDIQTMMPGDVIINEILFNPESGGSDFIELYNISDKIFNINGLEIENQQKTSGDTLQTIKTDFLLLPGAFVAVTEEPQDILSRYNVPNPAALLDNNLPTFDDDEGNITIRFAGVTIDSFDYSDDLHFALLDDDEGVSLERISTTSPTQSPGNWHSAASTAGFATPGYQNSQFFTGNNNSNKVISLSNNTFSPDGDGFEDILIIEYNADQPGLSVNIRIFDANGRLVKRLIDNESLAAQGNFKWDGTTDDGTKARIGIYVVWTELFSPGGRVEQNKSTCVLAGKLN
ncbi:MAG: lamin tail domain-containing protein [Saprospiraceae bacterium]|nr:lamin tail domain-containing protein [Saprospiraceae bacterium]